MNKVSLYNRGKSLILATSLSSWNVMCWNLLCNLKHAVAATKLEKSLETQFLAFQCEKDQRNFLLYVFSQLKKTKKILYLFLI